METDPTRSTRACNEGRSIRTQAMENGDSGKCIIIRVSFRFLPKREENKDIRKVGGSVGASILSRF